MRFVWYIEDGKLRWPWNPDFGWVKLHQWIPYVPFPISHCTRGRILYRSSPKSLYFAAPFAFNTFDGGVPLEDLRKNYYTEVRRWLMYTAVKKFCRKLQPTEYGAPTLKTDERRICDSVIPERNVISAQLYCVSWLRYSLIISMLTW